MSDSEKSVRFIPLGGLGEIGMNCFALETAGRILVVDCGMGFPDDDLGVDILHPDFSWLYERASAIDGIFITHGHEDHIGALPYLLRQLGESPPIYAPPHAAALIRQRFVEHNLDSSSLIEVQVGSSTLVGPFTVESVAVAHSIVDATALCIDTPAGVIVHTGDFDVDDSQPAGHLTDGHRFRELGDRGVRLLLSDSTNVDNSVRQGSEGAVVEGLARVIQAAMGRVVVGLFSSNIHRLLGLFSIAERSGRKVCLLGRSLSKHYEVAREVGKLPHKSSLLIGPEQLAQISPERVLVLAGGSQGEAASALRRLSKDTHQHMRLNVGDTVVLSSRVIPGNEREVSRMINDFLRLGVEVKSRATDPDIHTSGHAGRSEQMQMIEWVRPQSFVPVHGTLHHMRRHAELAEDMGVIDTLVVENGTPVRIRPTGPLTTERVIPHGITRIAMGGEELDPETHQRRLDLARGGIAVIFVGIGKKNRIEVGPTFSAFGIPTVDRDPGASRAIHREVTRVIEAYGDRAGLPIEETIRRAVRRMLVDWTGSRPVVEVHVSRTGS